MNEKKYPSETTRIYQTIESVLFDQHGFGPGDLEFLEPGGENQSVGSGGIDPGSGAVILRIVVAIRLIVKVSLGSVGHREVPTVSP